GSGTSGLLLPSEFCSRQPRYRYTTEQSPGPGHGPPFPESGFGCPGSGKKPGRNRQLLAGYVWMLPCCLRFYRCQHRKCLVKFRLNTTVDTKAVLENHYFPLVFGFVVRPLEI